ncbi:MAG TPA: 3,4-dihydroxy-2-butanone-4-phosphate synthase, partial [Prolixibacteraceae bacterium]|nr:3,4-dihydroxy-2-butanone-4-phosphate synthase [Prolixibacteraceae bacterium]
MSEFRLDPIPDAIEAFKNGEFVIVVDDEDRENEGDLICASSLITPEKVNFMTIHARGLICISLSEKRCEELELHMMSNQNTSFHSTQFT